MRLLFYTYTFGKIFKKVVTEDDRNSGEYIGIDAAFLENTVDIGTVA